MSSAAKSPQPERRAPERASEERARIEKEASPGARSAGGGVPGALKRVSLLLRIAVSIGLIALMVAKLDTGNMLRFIRRADIALVAATLLAVLADRALMALRWMKLVEALGVEAPRSKLIKIFFLSTFFGSFLPSGVGGEAVRAISFSRLTSKGIESVASVAVDRLIGLLSMLLTGLFSLTVFYEVYPHPALLYLVLGGSLLLLAFLGAALARPLRAWMVAKSGSGRSRLAGWIQRGGDAMDRYREKPEVLLLVLAISIGVQLLRILQAYLLSEAMGLGTAAVYFLCFIPPILVLTMLPISVGGWGTANLAYVALFSRVGMDPDGAFALSVLILGLGVVGNLPGGLIYALEGFASTREA
ncbi:MAG TPA: lysylphosphatidylglycerol synthase transmembrane domain-containing protein [Vicinamibacteria bacterium]